MSTTTLARAERFSMTAQKSGRSYEIHVARPLPLHATGELPVNCPIFITLDPEVTFCTAVERSSFYAAIGYLQSAVIVGVGYQGDVFKSVTERAVDFTADPNDKDENLGPWLGNTFGGAEDFLNFLIDEVALAVRDRAPEASADRLMLNGFSLGGMFAAYALLARPEVFEVVSIISGSFWWNDFSVLKGLPAFAERLISSGARPRVLVGVGSLEQEVGEIAPPGVVYEEFAANIRKARMVDAAREFSETLSGLPVGDVTFAVLDGERHAGAATAGTVRAIGFALEPR